MFSVSHNITRQTPQTLGNLWETRKIYRRMPEEYLMLSKNFSACFIDVFERKLPNSLILDGNRGFSRIHSGRSVKFIAYLQLEVRIRNNGIVQVFPQQSAFMAWPGTN